MGNKKESSNTKRRPKELKTYKDFKDKPPYNNSDVKIFPMGKLDDANGGHFHFILEQNAKENISVPITSQERKGATKNSRKNKPLAVNPLPHVSGKEKSYVRRERHLVNKNNYSFEKENPDFNYAFIKNEDYEIIKNYKLLSRKDKKTIQKIKKKIDKNN